MKFLLLLFAFSLLAIEARLLDPDTIPEEEVSLVKVDSGVEDEPFAASTDEGRKVAVRTKKEKSEETCAIDVDNNPNTDMSTCPLDHNKNEEVKDMKQLTCYDLMVEQDRKNKKGEEATKEEKAVVNLCLKNWAKEKLKAKYEGIKGKARWAYEKAKFFVRKFISWLKGIPGAANDKILAYAVREQSKKN